MEIPFEIHITTASSTPENRFVEYCNSIDAKPILIKLAKGNHIQQPMLSKHIYAADLKEILAKANDLTTSMQKNNLEVKRLKIEVQAKHAHLFQVVSPNFKKYYEWHGKIKLVQEKDLLEICTDHQVHLSLNSLRNESDIRFVTLREFGTELKFKNRVTELSTVLNENCWPIIKEQFEFCIYDNNIILDSGWLPQ